MCRVLKIKRSYFYVWVAKPQPSRAINDMRLLRTSSPATSPALASMAAASFTMTSEHVGRKHVERLMRRHGLYSVRSPLRRRYRAGKPAVVAPKRLQR